MRHGNFTENEYYHIFNKGVGSEKIFVDDKDCARFIFLITHLLSPIQIYNISWYADSFLRKGSFSIGENKVDKILKKKEVELISFVIMPNYFDILIRNLKDNIASVYMHRILTSYSKYYNAKYNKKGHVFHGPFGATRIKNNNDILNLSAQIHKSPENISEWKHNYDKYPWSSFQDYIGLNRWGNFLSIETVLKQFKDQTKYKDFVIGS
jgi:putative transposase